MKSHNNILFVAAAAALCGCTGGASYEMGTYGYDLDFLAKHEIPTVELAR